MITQMASSNTILQTVVEEGKRGRVMSLFAIAFLGMAPFGSLYAGIFAHLFGVRAALMSSGILSVLCAAIFTSKLPLIRSHIRPIYVKMGIIPEVARAMNTVSDLEVIADKE